MAAGDEGYGSELHLLRYLGRHRAALSREVLSVFNVTGSIEWLDFPFRANRPKRGLPLQDAEWKGLDFLQDDAQFGPSFSGIQEQWSEFWPTGAGVHNWDAVAWIDGRDGRELLLVEAKANKKELRSKAGAADKGGLSKIRRAFRRTETGLGVAGAGDWTKPYYQAANRIAAWYFLTHLLDPPIPTRLLFIYFSGDLSGPGRDCPVDEASWDRAIRAQDAHLGRPYPQPVERSIRKVFLPVAGVPRTTAIRAPSAP